MNCLITEEEQDLGKNCDFINVVKIAIPNLRYCKFAVNPLVIGQFHSFKRKKYIFFNHFTRAGFYITNTARIKIMKREALHFKVDWL